MGLVIILCKFAATPWTMLASPPRSSFHSVAAREWGASWDFLGVLGLFHRLLQASLFTAAPQHPPRCTDRVAVSSANKQHSISPRRPRAC
ncbi:hypothetical protein QBC39DRAFT_335881 [Podospora conica]|nr:hypothetical protein QBC39DRAFT_335881 [Schizothecium conicum]